jgi:hypothetical protein
VKPIRIDGDVLFIRDVEVRMRDGVRLMANVFRPADERPCPVVMSVTPYGKDVLPDWIGMTLMRLAGVRFGRLACSNWTGFEAPDPLFWTRAGFAVVQADVRGMHKSEGHAGVLTDPGRSGLLRSDRMGRATTVVDRRRRFGRRLVSAHVAMARGGFAATVAEGDHSLGRCHGPAPGVRISGWRP